MDRPKAGCSETGSKKRMDVGKNFGQTTQPPQGTVRSIG